MASEAQSAFFQAVNQLGQFNHAAYGRGVDVFSLKGQSLFAFYARAFTGYNPWLERVTNGL